MSSLLMREYLDYLDETAMLDKLQQVAKKMPANFSPNELEALRRAVKRAGQDPEQLPAKLDSKTAANLLSKIVATSPKFAPSKLEPELKASLGQAYSNFRHAELLNRIRGED
jgi:hypothetical protein